MTTILRDALLRQFDTAWALTTYHLDGLSHEECLWRPTGTGPHVHRDAAGDWRADWPEHEDYEAGAPSIGWITWHMIFWWTTTLEHAFGSGDIERTVIAWPGDPSAVRSRLEFLRAAWVAALAELDDRDLAGSERTRWPFRDRPFADVVAWLNLELMKNAAELGYARFVFAGARSAPRPPARPSNPGI